MWGWFTVPALGDPEVTRKAHVLMPVLQAMALLAVVAFGITLLDSRNSPLISFGFYAPVLLVMLALAKLARAGRVVLAAWIISLFFWTIIAATLPFFGGMQGHNAAVFAVSIMLIGSLVGSRPALVMAALSSAWCGLIVALEMRGALPKQLGPYSPVNAWIALSATLLLTTVLLRGTLRSLRDLHERAEANAKARDDALRRSIRSQKMELVGNLSSGVAHDFNNLLTVIGSASQHLREHLPPEPGEVGEVLDDLEAATQRANLMTRQLLSFARVQEGALGPLNLGEVVGSFAGILPRLLGSKIEVRVSTGPDVVVSASPVGLEQVLLNLAVNARDAMPNGGTLTIEVTRSESAGVLSVADTGAGISEEARGHIFEAFFTTKPTGTGLGLATVHEVVSRFGGKIGVESAVDKGTTFVIELPLSAPKSMRPTAGRGESLANA
jgi:signal transduction histidine kinase